MEEIYIENPYSSPGNLFFGDYTPLGRGDDETY
jgi:hypothetical protein